MANIDDWIDFEYRACPRAVAFEQREARRMDIAEAVGARTYEGLWKPKWVFSRFYEATFDNVYTRLGWHVDLVNTRCILPLPLPHQPPFGPSENPGYAKQ